MFHVVRCVFVHWLVALLFLHVGTSFWFPNSHLESYISKDAGPRRDYIWRMKGSEYNDDYCPLSTIESYPYLVKIYVDDPDLHSQVRTGVLLSHKAVLTVCQGFSHFRLEWLSVTAQRVFARNAGNSRTTLFCYQTRKVVEQVNHPRCDKDVVGEDLLKFWDYSVLVLDQMFAAERELVYPLIQIPKTPYELTEFIRKLKTLVKGKITGDVFQGCEMPYFKEIANPWPAFEYRAEVNIFELPNQGCVDAICYTAFDRNECSDKLKQWMGDGFLCLVTKWQKQWPNGDAQTPEIGAPLVCNNTGVGLAAHHFKQLISEWDPNFRYPEMMMVNTFLRVWPWVMEMKHNYWNASYNRLGLWDSPFLEQHLWRRYTYTTEKWDKDVAKDPKRFHFFIPGKKRPVSDGNIHQAIFPLVFASLIHVSLILMIFKKC